MRSTMSGAHVGHLAAAAFQVVQRCGTNRQPLLVALVPFGDPRVEIPAVVVESGGLSEMPHVGEGQVLELAESDDDVGHLDAGVVDVVLHFDRRVAEAQDARERVAERRIPQMADVRGLVRIDGGMLDHGLAGFDPQRRDLAAHPADQKRGAIEIEIEIAVRCDVDPRDSRDRSDRAGDLLGDGPRRLAQRPRQLERDRHRQIAQRAVGRDFDGERRKIDLGELPADRVGDGRMYESLER